MLLADKQFKALLDVGAFFSCVRSTYLTQIKPDWKNFVLELPKAKFSSCNSTLEPLGVIELPLIFPHSKGSLRLNVEFVIMEDILSNYLIVGNDALCLYGIDIIQSRGRYFTIGEEWKIKFQICNINDNPEPQNFNPPE